MAERLRWLLDNHIDYYECLDISQERNKIIDLIDQDLLSVHFQPIFSAKDGSVYAYEALTRIKGENPFANIGELFKKAIVVDFISHLDVACRRNAITEAAQQGIAPSNAGLCINISPETLMDPFHPVGITDELVSEFGIPKEKIIIEITEESAIHNSELFKKTVLHYRERGYKIAIDDFGAGYGGLKMLSIIEPEYVKIDCHFISNIDKATIKHNLVDAIATACHRMGSKIIAEGIEREEELNIVLNMGIELLQGYYLGRPAPQIFQASSMSHPKLTNTREGFQSPNLEIGFMGDIANKIDPISPSQSIVEVFHRFTNVPELRGLPIVDQERVIGMLHRQRFLENDILGRCGYGFALNTYKQIPELMEKQFFMVEANVTIQHVAQRLQTRKNTFLYDDICVTQNGKYLGTVSVISILDAMTEKSIRLAQGANPLSGLPGNEFIQREIETRLSQKMHFDVCYIDLDNFKPFNDHYGFERGDLVIKTLAQILKECLEKEKNNFNFVGHIGGDDFIMILRPHESLAICQEVIESFESQLATLHSWADSQKGFYYSKNRHEIEEKFNLLSLSIGIVSTEVNNVTSYGQIASLATEVKKAAKKQEGSSIVRDKRLLRERDFITNKANMPRLYQM